MLQEIDVLHVEVVGGADGTNFWYDQEVARSNRVRILKRDNCVVLVHNVRWFLLPNYSCKHVLLEIANEFDDVTQTNKRTMQRGQGCSRVERGVSNNLNVWITYTKSTVNKEIRHVS